MYNLTILTATYNRGPMLDRLFNSLLQQTSHNFKWLIVDDGSTDRTKLIVDKMIEKNPPFTIDYFYQNNGGKHTAINKALGLADGDYIYIVDSDDYLPINSIETIHQWVDSLKYSNKKIIGVSGLKAYPNDTIVGKTFNDTYVDCKYLERDHYNIYGDKAEVYKLSELKKYRFPVVEGENFMTEAILWNKISNDGYHLRYFNEIIYYCEYLEDGLTKNINKMYINNFEGYTLYTKELLLFNLSFKKKFRAVIAYCYRAKLKGESIVSISDKLGINKVKIKLITIVVAIYERYKDIKAN